MLYPLSYTGVIPVAGFEPATTRVRCEATLVFTTGRISRYRLPLFSPGNARKEFEADLFRYLLLRGYAPVPETQQLGEGASATYSLWPGNSRTRQGLRPEDSNLTTHLCELLAKEVSVTNHHWPCVVRLGEYTAAACRVPVEGTAAYATQRVLGYLDCVRGKLVTDVTKRRPHATQAV